MRVGCDESRIRNKKTGSGFFCALQIDDTRLDERNDFLELQIADIFDGSISRCFHSDFAGELLRDRDERHFEARSLERPILAMCSAHVISPLLRAIAQDDYFRRET